VGQYVTIQLSKVKIICTLKEYKISSLPIIMLDNFGEHLTIENFEKLKYHKLKKGLKSQKI
jgi:hypothetical protein